MHQEELRERIRSHFLLKGVGSTVVISAFFVAYFFVLFHPVLPVQPVPVLGLDEWIPVLPWSVWVYFSLWVYICLPQALMRDLPPIGHYLLGATVLAGLGLLIFIVWPTAVPIWTVDWSDYPSMAFLKEADAAGNACPSLHVAFAVFSGLWLRSLLKRLGAHAPWHWGNIFWCLAIVASTMTTKQHVVWDVLSGVFFGGIIYAGNWWWMNRCKVEI